MKLLIQSAMIFFGTLMAAGLLALGEPASKRLASPHPRQAAATDHRGAIEQATETVVWYPAADSGTRNR